MQPIRTADFFGRPLLDFFDLYARFLVSYIVAVFFVPFGLTFFIDFGVVIPLETKIIFGALSVSLLVISYLVHTDTLSLPKTLTFLVRLGNVFGFLLNLIYVAVRAGHEFGYRVALGGAERFVFYVSKPGDMNLIENMYNYVEGAIYVMALYFIVGYGLSMRDSFKKQGKRAKAVLSYTATVGAGFGLFLFALFYQPAFAYVTYFITGSMLFIYGSNVFRKDSFLKL